VAVAVKVCGVRDAASARACAAAGADLAGLNFWPRSRRCVDVEAARGLVAALGPVTPVGVFRDQPFAEVRGVAEAVGLGWVQLHGAETPADCAALRAQGLRIIKALPVRDAADLDACAAFADVADLLLLDAPKPGGGRPFDHGALRGARLPLPFLLAGGLTPENVGAAVARVRPHGVDAASGVEVDGAPSPDRVAAFCRAARAAAEVQR
jgi:phosphoribosylanthranilate isomerase